MVASISSPVGSALPAMRVPGLARNFWTMHSWTLPCRSWTFRISSSVSTLSSTVSPIPIKIPVVKGTLRRPASSMVPRRLAGTLSGEAQWARFGPSRRSVACSSMVPCETETRRSTSTSSPDRTPGLACGRSPVFSSTSPQQWARYSIVVAKPISPSSSIASG